MTDDAALASVPRRRFWANRDPSYKAWICIELLANLPELSNSPFFLRSAEHFIASESYTAFCVDEVNSDGTRHRYGGGLLGAYTLPFQQQVVFGVEAAWFRDDDPFAHAFIWQYLVNEAVDIDINGLCVSPATVSHAPRLPAAGMPHNRFGIFVNNHLLMAGPIDAAWSAFVRDPTRKPQFVNCIRVVPQREISLRGTSYDGAAPLFRGEGRVNRQPYEGCLTLRAVAEHVFAEGFTARGTGGFSGTIQEQILHQGYVSSPTVSMTAEFDVGVYYGTSGGQIDRALVFEIDPDCLRRAGPIWDTFNSMKSGRMAWLESDFDIIVKLVLGVGDLREAGSLIKTLDAEIRRFGADYEATLQGTSADYERYVGADTWSRAMKVLEEPELSQLCSVLEAFFYWSEGPDGIIVNSGYVAGFLMVREKLEHVLQAAAPSRWQHPGWDNTVFGYAAKTCRDREFLSTGPISGFCIKKAHLVDRAGSIIETYWPSAPLDDPNP